MISQGVVEDADADEDPDELFVGHSALGHFML
jgi:hypothetical protein